MDPQKVQQVVRNLMVFSWAGWPSLLTKTFISRNIIGRGQEAGDLVSLGGRRGTEDRMREGGRSNSQGDRKWKNSCN